MSHRALRIAALGTRGIPSTYSGLERIAESLYAVLATRGHAITVYCRPECLAEPTRMYRGIRLVRLPALRGRAVETVSHVTLSMLHALTRERYDVLHLHALAPGLLAPLARLRGVPMVSSVQGVDWQRAKWRGMGARIIRRGERWMVRHADAIVAVSHDLEAYYRERYGRHTVVIPNGTDPTPTDEPVDTEWLATHGLVPGRFVLFVARLVPEKRVEDLIAAFRRVETPWRLAITGGSSHTDEYVAALRAQADDDARVVFLGTQPRARVDQLYRGAGIYVHPSELEGMPMAVLQGLEAGVPAVVSDLPVHRELLDGVAGYDLFFRPRDVDALAARLTRVLADLPRYQAVAAAAQQRVQRTYSWEAVADQFEAVFRDVVACRTARGSGYAAAAARSSVLRRPEAPRNATPNRESAPIDCS